MFGGGSKMPSKSWLPFKEQLKGPTTPEVRRALAERLNRLQEEIQLLRGKLPASRKSG